MAAMMQEPQSLKQQWMMHQKEQQVLLQNEAAWKQLDRQRVEESACLLLLECIQELLLVSQLVFLLRILCNPKK